MDLKPDIPSSECLKTQVFQDEREDKNEHNKSPISVMDINILTQKNEKKKMKKEKKPNLSGPLHPDVWYLMAFTCMPFVGDSSEDYKIAWIPFLKAMARINFNKRYVHNDYALAHLCVWDTPVNAKTPWLCDMCRAHGGTIVYHVTLCRYCKCKDFHERLPTESGHPTNTPHVNLALLPKAYTKLWHIVCNVMKV